MRRRRGLKPPSFETLVLKTNNIKQVKIWLKIPRISVRIEFCAGSRKVQGNTRHDSREGNKIPSYVNSELSGENSYIEYMDSNYKNIRKEYEKNLSFKPRSDSAEIVRGIITFSSEAQPIVSALPKEKQDAMYKKTAERLSKELDLPIVNIAVHRDESAPHAHFVMLNCTTSKGKSLRAGKDTLRRLQDIAADAMHEEGLNICRGKPKIDRIRDGEPMNKIIHRNVRQLHLDLPSEIELKKQQITKIDKEIEEILQKEEKNRQYLERANQKYQSELAKLENADRRRIRQAYPPLAYYKYNRRKLQTETEEKSGDIFRKIIS